MDMKRNKCCASVITYNPNVSEFLLNIQNIVNGISEIIIIDNNSSNFNEIENILNDNLVKYKIIKNKINIGVGAALNQALNWAIENDYEWLLTFDQDSRCDKKFFDELFIADQEEKNVAIYYPQINVSEQDNFLKEKNNTSNNIKKNILKLLKFDLEMPITSGALMNVNIIKQLGGYDSEMFIDGVDFDIDIKIHKSRYKMIKQPKAILYHKIGSPKSTSRFIFSVTASGHSVLRCFYMNRNAWILFYKYYDFCFLWLIWNILRVWVMSIRNAFFSEEPQKYIISGLKGQFKGITKNNKMQNK